MFQDINAFVSSMREKYPDMKVYVDDHLYWYTVVVSLTDTNVVLFHQYFDNPMYEEACLMDATIDRDNGVLRINAFVGFDHIGSLSWVYLQQNKIPLEFLQDTMRCPPLSVVPVPNIPVVAIGDWEKVADGMRLLANSV